jgi:hypothetical protein
MIPHELTEGVQKMLDAGAPREMVQEFLLEKGWSEDDARSVFSEIDENIQKKKEEKTIERGLPAVAPVKTISVPADTLRPQPTKRLEGRREDVPTEKKPEPTPAKQEQPKEKTNLALTQTKEQAPEIPTQKHKQKIEQGARTERDTEKEKTPKTEAVKKTPEGIIQQQKPENKKESFVVKPDEQQRKQEPSTDRVRKENQKEPLKESADEIQETELFGVDTLSGPLVLIATSLSYVKERFWNLFFLSFMVSVLTLILYVLFSYIVTAQRLDSLWAAIVISNSNLFLITPLLVLALMLLGSLAFTILLWLPSAYILSFSGRKSSFRDLFFGGFTGAFSLFISSVFVLLFVLSGFFLLLIPGIVFAVWFVFTPIISVAERTSPFVALLISRELVRNHFWDVVSREIFLLIPTALFALLFILLLSPLALLDSLGESLGLGIGLIVITFVGFAALLFVFAFLLFFFAYHVTFYKEMRTRIQTVKLSRGLSRTLPLLLIIPLVASLAVALYVSSIA